MQNRMRKYYFFIGAVVTIQTVFSCVRMAQNVAYHDRLAHLQTNRSELLQELQTKQSALNNQSSLLAHQNSDLEKLVPISSPLLLSSHDTIASR